jgi:chromosome segregation ATPase
MAPDARARDLDNGRKKLEEFRARKAARAASLKRDAAPNARVPLDDVPNGEPNDTYSARLEAKLAELGSVAGSVREDAPLDGVAEAVTSPESARARPQVIDEDYGATLDEAAAKENARIASERALYDAKTDYRDVNDAMDAIGADKIAGDVAGELQRELETLREEFAGERERLEEEIASLEREVTRLKTVEPELEALRVSLDTKEAAARASAEEVAKVRDELAAKVDELSSAAAEIEEARAGMEEMKSAVEEAKKQSKDKVKRAIAKGKSIEAEKKALEEEMTTLRSASEEHAKLTQNLAEAESKLAALQNDLNAANDKAMMFEGMDDALAEEKIRNKDLQAQLVMLKSLEAKEKPLEVELAAAKETVEKLKAEVQNAQSALESAQADVEAARADADAQTMQLREDLAIAVESLRKVEESAAEEQAKIEEERAQFVSQIDDITEQLGVSERAVFEKDAEIQSLVARIEDAQSSSNDDVARLQAALEAAEQEKQAQSTDLLERLNDVSSQLEDAHGKFAALSDENATLESEIAAKIDEIAALTSRVQEASQSSNDETRALRAQLEELSAENASQSASIAKLSDAARATNEEANALKAAKTAVEDALRAKDHEIARAQSAFDDARGAAAAELVDARSRLDAAETEKSVQHEQLVEINARMQAQTAELAALNSAKLSAEDTVAKRDEEIAKLTEHMRSLESSGDVVGELQARIELLTQGKESLEAQIVDSKTGLQASQDEIKSLSSAKERAEGELSAKDAQIAKLTAKAKKTKKASDDLLAALRAKLDAAEQEKENSIAQLREEISAANVRVQAVEKEAADVAASKSALEKELAAKCDHINELSAKADEARGAVGEELSHTQAKLDAMEEEKIVAEKQLKEYVERLQGVDAELSALKDEKEKLKVAITEKNQETSQLREHIKSMNAGSSEELSRVNEALTDLRVSHESAIAEREALLVARADVEERLAKVEAERDSLARDVASTSEAASRVAVLEKEIADIRVAEEKTLAETTALVEEKSALIARLTAQVEEAKTNGAAGAQSRIGELNAALGEAQGEVSSLRAELRAAQTSLASTRDLQERLVRAEANLTTSQEVQNDLRSKLADANAALSKQQSAPLPSTPPPPTSASRRLPRTPSDSSHAVDIESGDRAESPSKSLRVWKDSRVTGRVPARFQPIMEFCDNAFVRFFRVMRTQPSLRFAALSYWAILHAWLFFHLFVAF